MSKSKYDLIVRTRFQNPIPPPEFGPKLLDIQPDISRLGSYEFTAPLVSETPHPIFVDGEAGMPIQLNKFNELWDFEESDNEDNIELNPQINPELDDDDIELLLDPQSISNPGSKSKTFSNAITPVKRENQQSLPQKRDVSWLRRTEYLSGTDSTLDKSKSRASLKPKPTPTPTPEPKINENTPEGRAQAIENTFIFEPTSMHSLTPGELSDIRHPSKKNLRAVDTFEVLPDFETWANDYFIMRFADDPSDKPIPVDKRVENAIIRPLENNGEQWLQYFLPEDDDQYQLLKSKMESDELPQDVENQERAMFNFIREYNLANKQDDCNDVLLVFDDGRSQPPKSSQVEQSLASARPRGKGVYYKPMPTRMTVKKRRPRDTKELEEDEGRWDKIQLGLEPLTEEDIGERLEVEDYFMPGGPQRAIERQKQKKEYEEQLQEEERQRIKLEKIQMKEERDKERRDLMEQEMERIKKEKESSKGGKEDEDESEDEDFDEKKGGSGDDNDEDDDGEGEHDVEGEHEAEDQNKDEEEEEEESKSGEKNENDGPPNEGDANRDEEMRDGDNKKGEEKQNDVQIDNNQEISNNDQIKGDSIRSPPDGREDKNDDVRDEDMV